MWEHTLLFQWTNKEINNNSKAFPSNHEACFYKDRELTEAMESGVGWNMKIVRTVLKSISKPVLLLVIIGI